MNSIRDWNWNLIGVSLAAVGVLIVVYQLIESSEAEVRAEMHRLELELKSEMQRMESDLLAEMRRLDAERKAEMQRMEAERKAELAALSAKMDQFIERVDARLDEVEREQARLDAVNDLLVQQLQQR